MKNKDNTMYRHGIQAQSELKLSPVERIRLIFGKKIYVTTELVSQWKPGSYQMNSVFGTEKLFPRLGARMNNFIARFRNK